jgi:hypothetical protein
VARLRSAATARGEAAGGCCLIGATTAVNVLSLCDPGSRRRQPAAFGLGGKPRLPGRVGVESFEPPFNRGLRDAQPVTRE